MTHAFVVVLLVAGGVVLTLCCVGTATLGDSLDRLHCVGAAAFGALLVAVAIFVQHPWSLMGNKALATGLFLLLTGPVLVHATSRTAAVRDGGDWRDASEEHDR